MSTTRQNSFYLQLFNLDGRALSFHWNASRLLLRRTCHYEALLLFTFSHMELVSSKLTQDMELTWYERMWSRNRSKVILRMKIFKLNHTKLTIMINFRPREPYCLASWLVASKNADESFFSCHHICCQICIPYRVSPLLDAILECCFQLSQRETRADNWQK